mmetsp:Transcript_6942/g.12782  ORF Transcript_6942/g.12782 Transcript_6942/m.12782 type:complete len:347 (-) Transcript_6942:40-1080(-)|eukprot:CAMPEP_0197527618 /NCGR_PEP_ID=MMETSP1318-20131121/22358_1 /TAXON_ID=552666 /ORGANISM="Partenskyella glossopodia, Strain RCC365" /LENGTH=346 /DNA_ID=CAMNT_0043082369 /DNA_START=45 /DNA_END=1085 /DNA_ORIENTATION=+
MLSPQYARRDPSPLTAVPTHARTVYDSYFFRLKDRLKRAKDGMTNGEPPMLRLLMAGAAAGVTTKTSVAPLERIKILFQVQGMQAAGVEGRPVFRSIPHAAASILREEGIMAFWKGNFPNCLRVVPVYALKFGFNDTFKQIVQKPGQTQLNFAQLITSGTMAGLFQACITYPLELIRTRLTLGPMYGAEYKGIIDCARTTLQQEGFQGFYKGLTPTIWSGAPYVGLQMTCYELYTRNLGTKIQNYIGKGENTGKTLAKLTCGALSGITAQTLTYPGDTIRRRMQTDGMCGRERVYRGMMDCYRQIVSKEGGHIALFKGWGTNCIRAIPGAGIQFLAYDTFKALLIG